MSKIFKRLLRKLFNIHSPSKEWMNVPSEYYEHDTPCDLCSHKNECDLLEITLLCDTRRHFINAPFHICPLKEKEKQNGKN